MCVHAPSRSCESYVAGSCPLTHNLLQVHDAAILPEPRMNGILVLLGKVCMIALIDSGAPGERRYAVGRHLGVWAWAEPGRPFVLCGRQGVAKCTEDYF